jgi:hypothetical protein
VLRWNGVSWKRVTLPGLGYSDLEAVAATSAGNAWTVGFAGGMVKAMTPGRRHRC